MTQEQEERKVRVRDDEVARIPWREFLRSQFRKIAGFILLLVLLFIIIDLSSQISPDRDVPNPDGVIELSSNAHIYLIVISSVLFLLVLIAFTKYVLLDHREEFGITSWKQRRVLITFMLTTSFITLVYILLDISLINIYLMTFPTWLMWSSQFVFPELAPYIPNGIDRATYSTLRGYLFVALLGFLFIFPLTMFISILTRYGRKTITREREKERDWTMSKLIFGMISSLLLTGASYFISDNLPNEIISSILLFIALGFLFAAAIFFILIIIVFIRFTAFFSYTNFLLIFPFIFLFYLLPGGLWGLWDLIVVVTTGGVTNTIYATDLGTQIAIDPTTTDIGSLSSFEILRFYLQTVALNLRPAAFLRIIELDFIIVIGISAVIIGFAEGYSILAIFRSIAKGVSIAKTGRVASRSAPKMVVITSRLFYLLAWLSLLWDNLITVARSISVTFDIEVPVVELPHVLEFVVDYSLDLSEISSYLLVLTILAVPFFFIITSAFKFLSVSLALERTGDDKQLYYLLISSAFILIVTNIFADIAALPSFETTHRRFLPLAGEATQDILPFVANIFDVLESFGFYAGVIATLILSVKSYVFQEEAEDEEDEEKQEDKQIGPEEEQDQIPGSQTADDIVEESELDTDEEGKTQDYEERGDQIQ